MEVVYKYCGNNTEVGIIYCGRNVEVIQKLEISWSEMVWKMYGINVEIVWNSEMVWKRHGRFRPAFHFQVHCPRIITDVVLSRGFSLFVIGSNK